jgi:anti-sigma regulatory factor (Ser/Thr protein kinase)
MRTSVGGDPAIELDLRLPAGATAPAYARAIVAGLGDRVADDLLDDLVLLVSEIVTNSVRHAALAPDESIRLRVRGTGRSIRLDIVDRGRGFDPPDVTNHDPARPDGWGLYIVDRLADRRVRRGCGSRSTPGRPATRPSGSRTSGRAGARRSPDGDGRRPPAAPWNDVMEERGMVGSILSAIGAVIIIAVVVVALIIGLVVRAIRGPRV